ncbi:ABC transporter ATP-binding protein [Pseudonocardia sp. MH-G8]|uniref:ABC transporter ATP-binding protein n=1 Tax=Pseudonocardia sp. MH-G8 TaxID=1854588 RepID=UPI000BA119B3|nr:ABC transporter ATP-binding protein [Pseudonocardia sp. MH-G8]OZM83331.1 histidinol phosphatase [Pseudonocardia sp. MH-G8]
MSIDARRVRWSVGRDVLVLDGVDLDVAAGAFVGLLGPNGSGKSTLLRLLAGVHRPDAGAVRLDGRDLRELPRRAAARRIALLAQESATEVDMTVLDAVLLGRIPHRARWGPLAADDVRRAEHTLDLLDAGALRDRRWSELSGGERQRVAIARALAQDPDVLLLDEPTNHLDVRHQLAVLELLAASPRTVVAALHDVGLAARYCDAVAVLHEGAVHAAGPPAQVLTPELLEKVYGVGAEITTGSDGRPRIHLTALPSTLEPYC